MKKSVRSLPVAEAVKQLRADLHLEYAAVPEWGRHIFTQHDRYSDALCRFGGGLLFWPSPIFGQRSNKSGSLASLGLTAETVQSLDTNSP